MKKILKPILVGYIATTMIACAAKTPTPVPRNYSQLLKIIEQKENSPSKKLEKISPTQNNSQEETILPPNMYGILGQAIPSKYDNGKEAMCAGYAYTISNSKYQKNMTITDAWNAAYHNKVISKTKNNHHIKKLILERKLTPGMIIACYYPQSTYNNRKDETGSPVKYTHLTVFAGTNHQGEPIFLQHLNGSPELVTLKELTRIFKPIEIIDEK